MAELDAEGIEEPAYRLLNRMMAKDPSGRFSSCDEVVAAIQKLLTGRQVLAPKRPVRRPKDPVEAPQTARNTQGPRRTANTGQRTRPTRPRAQKSGCLSTIFVASLVLGTLACTASKWMVM